MPRPRGGRRGPRRGPDVWFPAEHGAWAMLVVPLVAGVALAGPAPVHVPLALAWVAGYPASASGAAWLRARRVARVRGRPAPRPPRPLLVLGGLCVAALALTLLLAPMLVRWAAVVVPLLAVRLRETVRGRERSLLADGVTMLVASLVLLVGVDAVGDALSATVVVAWATLLATFLGMALAVKTMIRERGSRPHLVASLAWHAGMVVAALTVEPVRAVLGPGAPVLAVALLARAAAGPALDVRRGRPLRPLVIGLVELVMAVGLLALLLRAA